MRRVLATATAALLVVAACSTESTDTTTAPPSSTETTAPDAPTTTAAPATTETPATTEAIATTTTEALADGTLDDPVPPGTWARIGAVEAAVLADIPNATDLVLAENEFNESPAPGNRFVIWRVAVANAGEDATPLLSELSFSVVGPSAVAYDSSAYCGVIPDEFDQFRDVFSGGTVEGNLCWEVADDDADDLLLLVDEFGFSNDRVVFAAAGTEIPLEAEYPTPVAPTLDGPVGSRGNPHPPGTPVPVGEWDIKVAGVIEDATAEVLAENSFNEAPADGRQFTIVGIEATYRGGESDILFASTSFNVVGPLAVSYTGEDACGVIPGELDAFSEVFPGGTIAGNLCWSVRSEDVDGLVFYSQESFTSDGEPAFLGLR
jgi:hypothetical protein